MKRIIAFVMVVALALMGMSLVSAAGISASLTGPGTIRSNETITLNFNMSGTNIKVVQGTINFDASQLEYKGNGGVLSGWKVDISQSGGKLTFMAEDDKMTAPINGSKQLFNVSFNVKAKIGAKVTVNTSGVAATDGNNDFSAGNVSYSVTVAPSPSGNNSLKDLQVKNATISPAFSSDTTTYTANVPFDVTKLDVAAMAADAKASVIINNPSLVQNATTNVVITVTAENGTKKTYTIKVNRARDPNYVESTNNTLANIQLDKSMLSPAFQPDITRYIVWLPYEVDVLNVTGLPADEKAKVEVQGGSNLEPGKDNEIKIICTSENGETKEYLIVARRALPEGAAVDNPSPEENHDTPNGIAIWIVVLTAMLCTAGGFGAGVLFLRKRRNHQTD